MKGTLDVLFRSMKPFFLLTVLFYCAAAEPSLAQTKPVRARLPSAESLQSELFFQDAFAEGLRGTRPARLGSASTATRRTIPNDPTRSPQEARGGFPWSSVVSARTLEDEVKSLQIQLQQTITTPSKFSGGGYLDVRRMFTELAVLFAVIDQYDRDVRWQQDAALARDRFTRAAANTKTTSIQAFNESKQRRFDLEELVRGGSLGAAKPSGDEHDWSLINRAALMQRFTQSYDDGLAVWTANQAGFAKHSSDIRRESELLMLLSRVITQPGMEDGEDEDYVTYSRKLESTASKVLQALKDNDARAARQAASAVGQACVACHDDYRG